MALARSTHAFERSWSRERGAGNGRRGSSERVSPAGRSTFALRYNTHTCIRVCLCVRAISVSLSREAHIILRIPGLTDRHTRGRVSSERAGHTVLIRWKLIFCNTPAIPFHSNPCARAPLAASRAAARLYTSRSRVYRYSYTHCIFEEKEPPFTYTHAHTKNFTFVGNDGLQVSVSLSPVI